MAPSVQTAGRAMLVWMVAVAAGSQSATQAIIEAAYGRPGASFVWVAATVLVVTAAVNIERIKIFLEG